MHKVGFFMQASEEIYGVLRRTLPPDLELVTLSGAGKAEVSKKLRDIDFLIAGKVTREMLTGAPKLQFVQTPGIGFDGVDLVAAAELGVPVAVTQCGITDEVADLTFALLLAVARRVVELDRELRHGRWLMWDRRLVSYTLAGRRLGIVGLGRIGRAVAARASAFRMHVSYTDLVAVDGFERLPLQQLLQTSDVISMHVPLTAATRGMMSAERFALVRPGTIFLNTARGEVVDEEALVEALRSGRLAGAGLDVFAKEPPEPSNPLLSMDNVVLTPHVGSGTLDSTEVRARAYVDNVRRVLEGREPQGLVSSRS